MAIQFARRGMSAMPAPLPRSSFVRRVLQAREDAVKRRVRTWLAGVDDTRLLAFGFTPEDVTILRALHDDKTK